MKILITGGFGYLGGRLAQFFAQSSYQTILGSRTQTVAPLWLPQAKVARLQWNSLVDLEKACSGVDAVVHLAGVNAQDCAADPVVALEMNGLATARLLRAAVRQGVSRFVYMSTAHVYSSPLVGVITEETCPVNLHPYATSHRAGEDVVRTAHQCGEIDGIVIRLANAFGVPAHKNANCWMLLVNDLCRQAVTTRRIVLHSSGTQRRNFVTLTDACRAIGHLLELPAEKLDNGLFNLGETYSLRVVDLAEKIAERCYIILGLKPLIQLPEADLHGISQPLDYRIDKLLKIAFQLKGAINDEIDETLRFCNEKFEVIR